MILAMGILYIWFCFIVLLVGGNTDIISTEGTHKPWQCPPKDGNSNPFPVDSCLPGMQDVACNTSTFCDIKYDCPSAVRCIYKTCSTPGMEACIPIYLDENDLRICGPDTCLPYYSSLDLDGHRLSEKTEEQMNKLEKRMEQEIQEYLDILKARKKYNEESEDGSCLKDLEDTRVTDVLLAMHSSLYLELIRKQLEKTPEGKAEKEFRESRKDFENGDYDAAIKHLENAIMHLEEEKTGAHKKSIKMMEDMIKDLKKLKEILERNRKEDDEEEKEEEKEEEDSFRHCLPTEDQNGLLTVYFNPGADISETVQLSVIQQGAEDLQTVVLKVLHAQKVFNSMANDGKRLCELSDQQIYTVLQILMNSKSNIVPILREQALAGIWNEVGPMLEDIGGCEGKILAKMLQAEQTYDPDFHCESGEAKNSCDE